MSKKTDGFTMTAVVFRNIFLGAFALMLISSSVISGYGIVKLRTIAGEVSAVVNEASAISQTNTRTIELWNELQENKQVAEKASQVVADSKSYAYQDVIVRDLKNFARQAGIKIINYDFTVSQSPAGQPVSPSAQEAPLPGAVSSTPTNTPLISALKTTSVSVSVETPINYEQLLRFIHYIEQNLTKMQISKVSLSRAGQENPRAVNSDALTIEVYIR